MIGVPDEDTGQAIFAFVTLRGRRPATTSSRRSCASTSPTRSASSPGPKQMAFADDLPKTRSGKIMRRLLRDIAAGEELGDVSTLRDPEVVADLKRQLAT